MADRVSHTPRIGMAADGSGSLHPAYDPTKCPDRHLGIMRCVDCCKQEADTDVIECSRCGFQFTCGCTFDEDCA